MDFFIKIIIVIAKKRKYIVSIVTKNKLKFTHNLHKFMYLGGGVRKIGVRSGVKGYFRGK